MSLDIDLLLESKIFTYDMNEVLERTGKENDIHFVVIGAGGTGGYLIPNLGRMVGIKNKEGAEHTVTIVDADNVEEKNLLRQNFSPNDIAKNKAEVMATRYGRAFGETFYYLAEYIETAEQVKQLIKQEKKTTVIIDCVDNNKTRFILKEGIRQYHEEENNSTNNTIMISSGNEEYAGQVVFSYKIGQYADFYRENLELKDQSPDLIDIFPDMNIGLLPDEESCAERAVSAPQNIATNMTAADIIFGYVNKLLNDVPIDTLVYFFDSRTMIRKAYSGRETHVKELLRLVEGNENLSRFVPGEKWTGVDEVKAPTYEEVLSSSAEVDAILENAEELEENLTVSTESESVFPSSILEDTPDSEEVMVSARGSYEALFSVQDMPDVSTVEYYEDSDEPLTDLIFDDMDILRGVPYGIGYYENYETSIVEVVASVPFEDYLTQEGADYFVNSRRLDSETTEEDSSEVVSEVNTTSEEVRITGSLSEEPSFTFMGTPFNSESFGEQIDDNLSIYNDDTRDLGVRDVAADNLTSIIDELISLGIVDIETIEEFEDLWTNHHETVIDEIIDSHVNSTEEFESQQIPLQFEFEDEDTVNFNSEWSEEISNTLGHSPLSQDYTAELEFVSSSSCNVMGENEVKIEIGRHSLPDIISKLKERKLSLEIYASADLDFRDFFLASRVLTHVEEALDEVENMLSINPDTLILVPPEGLKHEGVVVLPALEAARPETPLISDEYILSHYQSDVFAEKDMHEVLTEISEKYVSITTGILNESLPSSEMPRAGELRSYITSLILSINAHKEDEDIIKINNHGAWIGSEKVMGIEINDIYRIRNTYSGVDVSIIDNPISEIPFREAIHNMTINSRLNRPQGPARDIDYTDLGPGIYKIEVIAYGLSKLLSKDIEEGMFDDSNIHRIDERREQINQLSEIFRNDEFRYVNLPSTLDSIARNRDTRELDYNLIRNLSPDERLEYIDINLP